MGREDKEDGGGGDKERKGGVGEMEKRVCRRRLRKNCIKRVS